MRLHELYIHFIQHGNNKQNINLFIKKQNSIFDFLLLKRFIEFIFTF